MEFREIDMALIREASKVSPDFAEMERLVRDGADVNAVSDSTFSNNVLSEVIFGSYSEEDDLPKSDSLMAVVEFFLKHGFDPSRDKGRAGAKCLANLTWSPCMASKIPTMKLLLDAGFRNIPAFFTLRRCCPGSAPAGIPVRNESLPIPFPEWSGRARQACRPPALPRQNSVSGKSRKYPLRSACPW